MIQKVVNLVKSRFYAPKGKLDYHTWIFSSVDNCNFNYNSKYLFLYVMGNCPEITPVFVINDREKRLELSQKYGPQYFLDSDSKEGLRRVLSAGVWFTSAGLPAYELYGHPGRIVVNLWHGIPLKKIVLLEEHGSRLQKLYFYRMFSRKYTDILTTSSHLVSVMARSFGVPREIIKVWGQPRNDVILSGQPREKLLRKLGIKEEEEGGLALYAPTYRDREATRLFPFADYNYKELAAFLKKRKLHICIRMHLKELGDEKRYAGEFIHFVNETMIEDIAEYMGCFSMLITDYSSIYLDYLLLDRPMIFLPYDKEEYLRDRGMNFPYDKATPGPKPATQKAFLEEIEKICGGIDVYKAERARCNDYFNQVREVCCPAITASILNRIRGK